MTRARHCQIDLGMTPFYHVINRCVRRSYLCGEDRYSGINYDHRRKWLIDRIKMLSTTFSIDIAAYAIMSNHYHLVLRVNRQQALNWSLNEVIERWYQLYKEHPIVDAYRKNPEQSKENLDTVLQLSQVWRARLYDISWFMKYLNESVARAANKEDNCTGKFWEGRYKSQALLDDRALLGCMVYVDLNPVRAGVCHSLSASDFTSIQERITQYSADKKYNNKTRKNTDISVPSQPKSLLPFTPNENSHYLPFSITDYLELIDWSCKLIDLNRQKTTNNTPSLLHTISLEEDEWLDEILNFRRKYGSFAGNNKALRRCAHSHGLGWHKGVT